VSAHPSAHAISRCPWCPYIPRKLATIRGQFGCPLIRPWCPHSRPHIWRLIFPPTPIYVRTASRVLGSPRTPSRTFPLGFYPPVSTCPHMSSHHPLPLTRQWVADYRRWGNQPKPEVEAAPPGCPFELWLKFNSVPDLLGPQSWENYDRQIEDWQRRRRER
jgi:hypothetical protein